MTGRLIRYLVAALTVGLLATAPLGADVAASGAPPEQAANTFVVRDVRIFDGVRDTGTGSVLVIHGRIAAVGRIEVPAGVPVYDGRGRTLLPGFIDGHAHSFVGIDPPSDPVADRRDALRFGVTTELDMFGEPSAIAEAKRQRRSLDRTDQADVWSAGIGVTVPDGLPPNLLAQPFPRLTPETDPDRFVADRIREGSDHLKLMLDDGSLFGLDVPTLTPAQIRAVITAAHRRGRLAVAHVTELEHARTAVAAGADGLVHLFFDAVADDAFARTISQRGTFVTPTMSTFDCGLSAEELLADPRVNSLLSAPQLRALNNRFPVCDPRVREVGAQNIGRLHAAGVSITAGTDAGATVAAHGASMLGELSHLVRAGLTPPQALTTATATPARLFHLGDRGRILPGFRADLLLVNGNLTDDITAVRDIATIWKNGYPVDRTVPTTNP